MWGDSKLVDVEIDDNNTGIHHVFEMRRGMNEFDHRSFFSFIYHTEWLLVLHWFLPAVFHSCDNIQRQTGQTLSPHDL